MKCPVYCFHSSPPLLILSGSKIWNSAGTFCRVMPEQWGVPRKKQPSASGMHLFPEHPTLHTLWYTTVIWSLLEADPELLFWLHSDLMTKGITKSWTDSYVALKDQWHSESSDDVDSSHDKTLNKVWGMGSLLLILKRQTLPQTANISSGLAQNLSAWTKLKRNSFFSCDKAI
jgi:hypothetical protein